MNKRMYINPRPLLAIELAGGRSLGNCYSATTYRITSTRKLNMGQLVILRSVGLIGYGQEHSFTFVCADGSRSPGPIHDGGMPTGVDVIQCSEIDERTGSVVRCPSINPYSGIEDQPHEEPFYVYECEDRVDSGD